MNFLFKTLCLSIFLSNCLYASNVLTGKDISDGMRAHLSSPIYRFDILKIEESVEEKTTTWAETLIRFAIELCLQSLNNNENEQKIALERGNDLFASMIDCSSPVKGVSKKALVERQIDKDKLKTEIQTLYNIVSPDVKNELIEEIERSPRYFSKTSYTHSNERELVYDALITGKYPELVAAIRKHKKKPYGDITLNDINECILIEIAKENGFENAYSFNFGNSYEDDDNIPDNFNNSFKSGLEEAFGLNTQPSHSRKLTPAEKQGALMGNKQAYEEELRKIPSWNGYARSELTQKYNFAVQKINRM